MMEPTDQKCQDTGRLPNLHRLPDEVLLEIFDFYRQSFEYDVLWRVKYAWFDLAHVCRRWRAIVFASSSRMDINIIVGPVKPGHIKSVLSSHLPILFDYPHMCGPRDTSGSALWRMRAALGHRDRVREISFGECGAIFKEFIKATKYHFPALESLILRFPHSHEPDIPATFLRGPDRSELRLRRLALYGGSLAYFSGLFSSVSALTDLTLNVTSKAALFDPSQGPSLLSCLQGMQSLRSLDLTTPYDPRDLLSVSQHSVPKGTTVPMSALTHFRYSGLTTFLNDLMSGLSAPSLRDVHFMLRTTIPLLYLHRVIDDVTQEFRSVSVAFDMDYFHLLSSAHSGEIDHFKPAPFRFLVNCCPNSINSMSSTPSTKLAMAEELTLNFLTSNLYTQTWDHVLPLREFLRPFRSVRVLRVNPFVREVGLHLRQDDDGETIMPALEEIELTIPPLRFSVEAYQRRVAEALAAFEPCERAGRLVKVYHSEQTVTQSRNARSW